MATSFEDILWVSLSPERLTSYKVYPCEPPIHIIERYFWNLNLAKEFYPLLQNLEISLRNRIHNEAINFYGSEFWFCQPFLQQKQAEAVTKARATVAKNKHIGQLDVKSGSIVAELSFGFWVNLLNKPYSQFFLDVLVKVFANVEKSARKRNLIRNRLDEIRIFRNRVFHHEPIWNHDVMTLNNVILEAIYWLDPTLYFITSRDSMVAEVFSKGIQPI